MPLTQQFFATKSVDFMYKFFRYRLCICRFFCRLLFWKDDSKLHVLSRRRFNDNHSQWKYRFNTEKNTPHSCCLQDWCFCLQNNRAFLLNAIKRIHRTKRQTLVTFLKTICGYSGLALTSCLWTVMRSHTKLTLLMFSWRREYLPNKLFFEVSRLQSYWTCLWWSRKRNCTT